MTLGFRSRAERIEESERDLDVPGLDGTDLFVARGTPDGGDDELTLFYESPRRVPAGEWIGTKRPVGPDGEPVCPECDSSVTDNGVCARCESLFGDIEVSR